MMGPQSVTSRTPANCRLGLRGVLRRIRGLQILLIAILLAGCEPGKESTERLRLIVLGIDGMDPDILERLMEEGEMEHFSRLRAQGGFRRLGTSMPPQSPVAWSNFVSGMNPGGHGIFDFLRHDRRTFHVAASTSVHKEPVKLFGLPVWGGGMSNLRHGKAFWEHLDEAGIDTTIFRVPSNFPPVGEDARTFAGMGTPDLRGSNGTFTYFTTEPPANAADVSGGVVEPVKLERGVIRTSICGPPNEYRDGSLARAPMTIYVGETEPVVRIDLGGERLLLMPGEWSEWIRLSFDLFPGVSARGIVRFYLKSIRPVFRLYASPVNIDPADPVVPIATPPGATAELCSACGEFYTQGMAEDTKALQWGVFNDEEFLNQAELVLDESRRLLDHELNRFRDRTGVLFFYISTIDQCSHMLWRTQDADHPAYRPDFSKRLKTALPDLYREMDKLLGRVLEEVDDQTTLIVMSDHGFAPFYRAVHLNNWLVENGYLTLYSSDSLAGRSLREDVDWSRSQAYALGFNGIYLNRFGSSGIVREESRQALVEEIRSKLLAWKDPQNSRHVVARVYLASEIYSGPQVDQAPDLVVGYSRGYRASWDTPIGRFGPGILEDNRDPWSGDHLMARELVPGVLLANQPLPRPKPDLVDLPVTILELFGIPRPPEMIGNSIFSEGD